MTKTLRLFTTLLCLAMCAWVHAETYTHTFSTNDLSTSAGDVTLSNVVWTQTAATYTGNGQERGIQIGKSASATTSFTLSTTGISGTITSVKVNSSIASEGTASFTVSVGGNPYSCGDITSVSPTTTSTDYEFTGSASGEIKIAFTNTAKAFYIKSITITYSISGKQTPTLKWSESSAIAIMGKDFTAPTLESTEGLEISYSSSNTDVATIDAKGNVTIGTTAGTTTITAKSAETETYDAAEASYELTVSDGKTIYRKVTSASDLVVGQEYILVSVDSKAALGEITSGTGGAGVSVTVSNDQVDIDGLDVLVFTLGGSTGAYTFLNGSNYLSLTKKNSLATSTSASTWTVNNDYTLSFTLSSTTYTLKYNGSASTTPFRCYSTNTGTAVYLFVKGEASTETIDVEIDADDYVSRYYGEKNLVVPAGVEVVTYTVADGKVSTSKTYTEGSVIPAGQAVVMHNAGTETTTFSFTVTSASGEADANSMLYGSDTDALTVAPAKGDYKFYKLSLDAQETAGTIGFYYGEDDGAAFTSAANRAYLAVPAEKAAGVKSFAIGGLTDAIAAPEADAADGARYNLAGQRVGSDFKGIVIMNGKKYLMK